MHYLLTEAEYNQLKSAANYGNKFPNEVELQKFCTLVANTMPAGVEWRGKKKPWGCILTMEQEWVCDECPAHALCPNQFKHYSK